MFKKLCIFMAALFTMLISCAGPLFFNANAVSGYPINFEEWKSYYSSEVTWSNNNLHVFFNIESENRTDSVCIILPPDKINSGNNNALYCEFANNILIIRGNLNYSIVGYYYGDSETGSRHIWSYNCYAFQLDFNTNTGYALLDDGTKSLSWRGITDFTFTNFETDWDGYSEQAELDLEVSFKPTLSGTITRNTVIDGKDYTSKSLDMYVSNNGSKNAQFSMFIVPSGGSVTFPSTNLNNSGFNPEGVIYAYVADEWSTFNYGFVGTEIQAPCTWHSVPSGYSNQLYSIPWNQMDLTANTNYDCVVYACLNDDMTQINNVSNGWDMRGTFSVSSNLNDVQEIYRSTFSITDPDTFNPDAINESGASHSWNQNTDNNALFNSSSAYRDDNGNIVIRGQTSGGNNVLTSFWDNSNFSINGMFGQYFMFLNGVFMFFPSPWQAIVTCGLITLVIIGVLKAVT